jgi:outer membrane protein OmpA-like peptidoglycan-associated protein
MRSQRLRREWTREIEAGAAEGEKQAETARVEAERRGGKTSRGSEPERDAREIRHAKETAPVSSVLPETIWTSTRTATLSAASSAKLEPLAALLASNPDYQILIEAYTDSKGNEVTLQQLTQERARVLVRSFPVGGCRSDADSGERHGRFESARAEHDGRGQRKNRRVEITFTSPSGRPRRTRLQVIIGPIGHIGPILINSDVPP